MANVLRDATVAPVSMTSFLLLRHASTQSNASARWHGDSDESVSAVGCQEAAAAGRRLREIGSVPSLIVSSNLRRAYQTAEIISQRIDHPAIVVEKDLCERDMGAWRGLAPSEVEAKWPGMLRAWTDGEIGGPPGGETDEQVATRARKALRGYRREGTSPILVITHGGIIRSLRKEAGLENFAVPHLGGYWAHLMDDVEEEWKIGDQVVLGDPLAQPLT